MIERLERWRRGGVGTFLFYGYALAILITLGLAIAAYRGVTRETARSAARSARSCAAYDGALAFWREARVVSMLRSDDPGRSPTQRAADERMIAALDTVIEAANKIRCNDE